MKQKPMRGTHVFSMLGQGLLVLQKDGFFRAMGFWSGALGLWALNHMWKARKVWYWRWSPLVSDDEYTAKDAICLACKYQKTTDKGRFCQQCGCPDSRWSELTVKNTRAGHFCPRGLHPGQTPMPALNRGGECEGCGSKKTNGKSAGAVRLEAPASLERTELATTDRR